MSPSPRPSLCALVLPFSPATHAAPTRRHVGAGVGGEGLLLTLSSLSESQGQSVPFGSGDSDILWFIRPSSTQSADSPTPCTQLHKVLVVPSGDVSVGQHVIAHLTATR